MIYMRLLRYVLLIMVVALAGCEKDDNGGGQRQTERTVLVYLVANNNLGNLGNHFDSDNIDLMLKGAGENAISMKTGRLLVYHVPYMSDKQVLFEVVRDKHGNGVKKVLKTYSKTNSLTKTVMSSVIDDMKLLAPAKGYGLIMWSHSTGWYPTSFSLSGRSVKQSYNPFLKDPNALVTRSFGADGGAEMELADLGDALRMSQTVFDFILFDSCFMSSIEVWYELRQCAKYIISSMAEVMGPGMPYDKLLPVILASDFDYRAVCERYMYYYRNEAESYYRYATISCAKTDELEALAQSMAQIHRSGAANGTLNLSTIQAYEKMSGHLFHDLKQYVGQLCTAPMLYDAFAAQLDKAVVFVDYTSIMYSALYPNSGSFPIFNSCGVTTFIPRSSLRDNEMLVAAHGRTAWAKAALQ